MIICLPVQMPSQQIDQETIRQGLIQLKTLSLQNGKTSLCSDFLKFRHQTGFTTTGFGGDQSDLAFLL
jgi:hypothetical protein